MLGEERDTGKDFVFNNRYSVDIKSKKDLDAVQHELVKVLDFKKFINKGDLESIKLNYAKKKIDMLIELSTPVKDRLRKDALDKVVFILFNYYDNSAFHLIDQETYDNIVERADRVFSKITIEINKEKIEQIFSQLNTDTQGVIRNTNILNTKTEYHDFMELLTEQVRPLATGTKVTKWVDSKYPKMSFSAAVNKVREVFSEGMQANVHVTKTSILRCRNDKQFYKTYINNVKIDPFVFRGTVMEKFTSLKRLYIDYFRLSARRDKGYFLFDIEPVLLNEDVEVQPNDPIVATNRIKNMYKRLFRYHKKKINEDIDLGYLKLTEKGKVRLLEPTAISEQWVKNAYNSDSVDMMIVTGSGIGMGMFYRRFAEYVSLNMTRWVITKFLHFSDDKNNVKNVRPQIVERVFTRHKNLKSFYDMIKQEIINGAEDPEKKITYTSADQEKMFQRQKYSTAASIGKQMWSYMSGEFLGISEIMADDVGGHGFSQYSDRVAFSIVIPLTNKFFKDGNNKINRFFTHSDLAPRYSHDGKQGDVQKLYGYFLKQLPADAAKYDFNDQDNYNCPVSALTKQTNKIAITNDDIMRIYLEVGMFHRCDIRVTSDELPEFYSRIANYLKINFMVRIYNIYKKAGVVKKHEVLYYFVGENNYYAYSNSLKKGKPMENLARAKTEKYINPTKKDGYKPFTVALCEGHVFNTNIRGSLDYLKRACEYYDELPDAPEIHDKMIEDICDFIIREDKLVAENPCYLLKNMTKRKEYILTSPSKEKIDEVIELFKDDLPELAKQLEKVQSRHPDIQRYKRKEQSQYFMGDFETSSSVNLTTLHDRNKFKSRNYDVSHTERECEGAEDLSTVVPYSNSVIQFEWETKDDIVTPIIKDSLFTFDPEMSSNTKLMLEWIIKVSINKHIQKRYSRGKPVKGSDDVYNFIFFHNFASFDGPILMYDAMRHIDLKGLHPDIKDVFYPKKIQVSGKPISFDLGFRMKNGRKISLSFRDSYKIISTPVGSLGSTFDIKVSKLKYPYGFYQHKFERHCNFKKKPPTVEEIEDDDILMNKFDEYIRQNDLHDVKYEDQMYRFISTKYITTDCTVTWKSIGIDGSDLQEIANGNIIRWKNKRYSKDFSGDEHIEDQAKRMFTDDFIIQMAKIAVGRAVEVTECEKQVEELNKSSTSEVVMFDYIEFCRIYNWYDCYNVIEAMCKFQQHLIVISKINKDVKLTNGEVVHVDMKDVKKVNIFQHRTISSIAFNIGLRANMMKDVCKLVGNTARFVNKKWGGKVFVNHQRDMFYSKNKEELDTFIDQKVTEENARIVAQLLSEDYGSQIDLDINSFYSWAISAMKTPTGKPFNIFNRTGDNIYARIQKMLDQGLPFWICCSYNSKYIYDVPENCCKIDGKNQWRNGRFTDTIIDDVKMRFLIEIGEVDLHEFEFRVSDTLPLGVAFKTWNHNAAGIATVLYAYRLENKKNVGLATVIKQILNNQYGKTIMKENMSSNRYIPNEFFENFMMKNKHKLAGDVISCGNYFEVKEYNIPCDYAIYPQFGSRVLTTSKTLSSKYAWILSAVDGKLDDIRANPDFKQPTDLKGIVAWTLKHSKEWMSTGCYHIESFISSTDTDSFNIPVQCLALMKPYVSKQMGDLESDYDFKRNLSVPDHITDPSWLIQNMQKSAVECYYCMPKTYTCRVMMTEKRGEDHYYVYRDHTKAKGVPKSSNPSFENIKSLYFGNPVKFFTTIKGDSTLLSFIHSRGLGLGQKRTTTVKEIMPYQLNTSKYYYAVGGVIEGHYAYGEAPLKIISDVKRENVETKYYTYNSIGVLEQFDGDHYDLAGSSSIDYSKFVVRVGSDIRCGVYDLDEPVQVLNSKVDLVDANLFKEFNGREWTDYKIVKGYSSSEIVKV